MAIKCLIIAVIAIVCVASTHARPQTGGIVTQSVRLPQLDSAHIAVQRVGGNFAYTVADSGPVHGHVQYAALPTVQYVPLAPTLALAPVVAAPAAPQVQPQATFFQG